MSKKTTDDLPSAADMVPAGNATPTGPREEIAALPEPSAKAAQLTLWLVSANGLDSRSIHAVDESDAVRQFYLLHRVKETEKHNPNVQRVS